MVTLDVEFLMRNMRFKHVLVSVHLLEALVHERRFHEAIALGQRVFKLLETWKVHSELLAVWYVTTQALGTRELQDEAFRHLGEYVLRHWHRPSTRPGTLEP